MTITSISNRKINIQWDFCSIFFTKIAKLNTREMFCNNQIAKLNTRKICFFSNCEIKYPRNLIPLRYKKFGKFSYIFPRKIFSYSLGQILIKCKMTNFLFPSEGCSLSVKLKKLYAPGWLLIKQKTKEHSYNPEWLLIYPAKRTFQKIPSFLY